MTAINKTALGITGKGATARIAAIETLAGFAYGAESGKASLLNSAGKALGSNPSAPLVAYVRQEIVIGIAAVAMPVTEFGKGVRAIDEASRLVMVRDWVLNYAAPSKAVSGKVPALRKGKAGWRSAVQDRIIRNAEKRASIYLAELNATEGKTDKQKNDARKGGGNPAPHHGKDSKAKATAPTHEQLVTPAKPLSAVEFAGQLLNMLSTAMQYDNKHAAIRPIEYSAVADGLAALHKVALKCDAALHLRLADQAETLEIKAANARKAGKVRLAHKLERKADQAA